jgi:DNA anti-recombination protein RmuC
VSETRDAFGPLLQRLQTEMRNLRAEVTAEMAAIRAHVSAQINARASETEAYIAELVGGLFDTLNRRLDQTERSVEERLTRIETLLDRP